MEKKQRLIKYLRGTGKALSLLADEIKRGEFDKESEETMSKIGAELLYNAKTYTFLS